MSQQVLLSKSLPELVSWVQEQGQPAYRGKQLHQWIYSKGIHSLDSVTVFPKQWRDKMSDYPVGRSIVHHMQIASDKTRKYLLQLKDGSIIETVGIPSSKRLTVCVSTQVGCPMACDFCATGKGGFERNLQAYEIVDQVLTVAEDFGQRVSNVVFMGMGEPLINLEQVVDSVISLNQNVGIGQRNLTISTVGLPKKIAELAQYQLQVTLAVSIHASNQAIREQLVPSAKHYPFNELLSDCRNYVKTTGRRISFEYILLAGVNDSTAHAQELAQKIKGFQCHVNVIPYNPVQEASYRRPSPDSVKSFSDALEKMGIAVTVRYSRGLDADAACGQLRASRLPGT